MGDARSLGRFLREQVPPLARYLHGRRDHRLAALHARVADRPGLPILVDGLVAGGDPAAIASALHDLTDAIVAAHRNLVPAVVALSQAPAALAPAVLAYTAARTTASALVARITAIDAAMAVCRCTDFAEWDRAVSEPLAAWTTAGSAAAALAPISQLVVASIAAQRTVLIAWSLTDADARGLAGLWDRAAALAHHAPVAAMIGALDDAPAQLVERIRADLGGRPPPTLDAALVVAAMAIHRGQRAISERRDRLRALGEALDRDAATPGRHATALVLAAEVVVTRALADALGRWYETHLADLPAHPVVARICSERDRLLAIAAHVPIRFPAILYTVDRLLGLPAG